MATKLNNLTPNLMVEDVNQSINYYHGTFGFNKVMSVPEEGELNWALLERDGVQIMLQKEESLKEDLPELRHEKPGGGFTMFIRMTGVEELFGSIFGKADIIDDLRTSFYGMKEFTVRDVNGYYLTFAEPVEGE